MDALDQLRQAVESHKTAAAVHQALEQEKFDSEAATIEKAKVARRKAIFERWGEVVPEFLKPFVVLDTVLEPAGMEQVLDTWVPFFVPGYAPICLVVGDEDGFTWIVPSAREDFYDNYEQPVFYSWAVQQRMNFENVMDALVMAEHEGQRFEEIGKRGGIPRGADEKPYEKPEVLREPFRLVDEILAKVFEGDVKTAEAQMSAALMVLALIKYDEYVGV